MLHLEKISAFKRNIQFKIVTVIVITLLLLSSQLNNCKQ